MRFTMPYKSGGHVKSADMKFGNDQISVVKHFDEASRWVGWSNNEFSHSLALLFQSPHLLAAVVELGSFGCHRTEY